MSRSKGARRVRGSTTSKYKDRIYWDIVYSYAKNESWKYIDSYQRVKRAGVVPYTYSPETGETMVMIGIDRKSGDYTDLAGMIESDETPIDGALREFYEESRGVMSDVIPSCVDGTDLKLKLCSILKCNRQVTIFYPVSSEWMEKSVEMFEKSMIEETLSSKENEISGLVWISLYSFKMLIDRSDPTLITRTKRKKNKGNGERVLWKNLWYIYHEAFRFGLLFKINRLG